MRKSSTALGALAIGIALMLTGCVQTGVHASRHTLYESVDGIAGDSALVLVVEISSQEVVKEDIDYTVSTAQVIDSYSPASLGSSLPEDARLLASKANGLTGITVRQLGTIAMAETPAPILEIGKRYLLFLTPTMLEGASASEFYVTGGDAGIYDASANDGTFRHAEFEAGDRLPKILDDAALSGGR